MPSITELGLQNTEAAPLPEEMPEQRSDVRVEIPQPGRVHLFKLPGRLVDCYERDRFDVDSVVADFKGPFALLRQPGDKPFNFQLSSRPFNQTLKDNNVVTVNPFAFLLRNGLGFTGPLVKLSDFTTALDSFAGKQFSAEVSWKVFSNPNPKNPYKDSEGNPVAGSGTTFMSTVEEPYTSKKGKKYAPIPQKDGAFVTRFTDTETGAILYVNGFNVELKNFQRA